MFIVGLDIGGTKCSVVKADLNGNLIAKEKFMTTDVKSTLDALYSRIDKMAAGNDCIFGISCGGPLDSKKGLILSPPNLPGWGNIAIVDEVVSRFGGKAFLMNDANAGALAEWMFGAGRNTQNMIFLTYGTGMGAGLILNGKLYEGTNGNAGEVGHIRLSQNGPIGYGKSGSFEGFCSGGGITQLAEARIGQLAGLRSPISAKKLAQAARQGNRTAKEIFELSGRYTGQALAVLVDILNPEKIILGSIFYYCSDLLRDSIMESLKAEALGNSLSCCQIVPTELGDKIGDYSAIAVALYNMKN